MVDHQTIDNKTSLILFELAQCDYMRPDLKLITKLTILLREATY
ncbi:hypothetical protein [Bartonella clarridgeiae]